MYTCGKVTHDASSRSSLSRGRGQARRPVTAGIVHAGRRLRRFMRTGGSLVPDSPAPGSSGRRGRSSANLRPGASARVPGVLRNGAPALVRRSKDWRGPRRGPQVLMPKARVPRPTTVTSRPSAGDRCVRAAQHRPRSRAAPGPRIASARSREVMPGGRALHAASPLADASSGAPEGNCAWKGQRPRRRGCCGLRPRRDRAPGPASPGSSRSRARPASGARRRRPPFPDLGTAWHIAPA